MCIYCGNSGPNALQFFPDSREYRCNGCGSVFNKTNLQQLTNKDHRFVPFAKRNPPAQEADIMKELFNARSI